MKHKRAKRAFLDDDTSDCYVLTVEGEYVRLEVNVGGGDIILSAYKDNRSSQLMRRKALKIVDALVEFLEQLPAATKGRGDANA